MMHHCLVLFQVLLNRLIKDISSISIKHNRLYMFPALADNILVDLAVLC